MKSAGAHSRFRGSMPGTTYTHRHDISVGIDEQEVTAELCFLYIYHFPGMGVLLIVRTVYSQLGVLT